MIKKQRLKIDFVRMKEYDQEGTRKIIEDFRTTEISNEDVLLGKVLKEKFQEELLPGKKKNTVFVYDFSKNEKKPLRLFFIFFNEIRLGGILDKKGRVMNLSRKEEEALIKELML